MDIFGRDALRPANVFGPNVTIDAPSELLALDEDAGLEVPVQRTPGAAVTWRSSSG